MRKEKKNKKEEKKLSKRKKYGKGTKKMIILPRTHVP